jgi:TetR/AcrR family transcriptional repressor of nem operon
MVRPREFEEAEVVEKIMRVFWEKGYEGTSMKDLVIATGLFKGSLYGAFGDKQSMYLMALAHYDETHIQAGVANLRADKSLNDKISGLFDSIIESMKTGVFSGGCLLCNASIDMAAVDEKVKQLVQAQIKRLQLAISNAIEAENSQLPEIEKLSAFVLSSYFGARIFAKAGLSTHIITDCKDQCLDLLKV